MRRETILNLPTPARQFAQFFAPTGKHRPARPVGAVVGQRFAMCGPCGVETAVTVHGDAQRCTEGHILEGGAA